jgi:hypothetical protein
MQEYNPKKLIKLVITRSVRSKESDEAKLTDFKVGQKVTMQAKYADELVSIRKAVVEGTPEHDAWIEHQKSVLAAKNVNDKNAATANELIEAKKKIADLEKQLAGSKK